MKTRFLATMSHDIRTPLNGIIGMVNMGNQYADDPQMQQKIREKVMESLKYLVSLVNDVLDMNKLESGNIQLERKHFNLLELLHNTNEITRMQANEAGVNYYVEDGEIVHTQLIGSPVHFQQILMNIGSNAVKYNKIHGKITLRVDMVSRTEDDVVYRFSVSDTGIGMSEEFQKHIFETFTQEDTGARTVYRGTGLGMAIAKKLVDALGGTIKIKSKKNVGSTFILVLPFAIDRDYENASVQSEPETPNVEGMHVLLVEDNELNLEIARYLLEEAGVQVIAAKNGQEALDIFEQSEEQEIDLILMDIMMPVMDGLEATRRIRTCTHPRGATVPIIAISANAFADDIQKAKNAGMNEHLAKPFEMEKVLRAISRYHKV